jgi:membrane protease YdiL (CAAX protease family)
LGLNPNPPFARDVRALTADRVWMVGVWALYWPCNILGEEFIWRGVLLPRMEAWIGARAWLINALAWGVFHAAFGAGNVLVLLPTLLLVPLVAQRRRSTWLAVLMHASLSLPGFVVLALGMGG